MICAVCKKNKETKLVTFLDEDLIRQADKLCELCINKAKVAKLFIGEGDQR